MKKFQTVPTDVLINSEDLRRRFKDVKELVHEKGNVGVLVNNRVDMVMMDVDTYNDLMDQLERAL
jgi:PHD/YefM family antitoxin component YafN of YafNO toxin-antitoxin module